VVVAEDELGGVAASVTTLGEVAPAPPPAGWPVEVIELGLNAMGIAGVVGLLFVLRRRSKTPSNTGPTS
jgi:hypothetical protein